MKGNRNVNQQVLAEPTSEATGILTPLTSKKPPAAAR